LPDVKLDYHCKDLPLIAERGAALLPEVRFFGDESCFDETYDLVMASGSLQYTENWRALLSRLAQAARTFLYITRLPVTERVLSFVHVQRPHSVGYNTEYLGWCLNEEAFLEETVKLRLRLVRAFVVGERACVVNAPGPYQSKGFLFRADGQPR